MNLKSTKPTENQLTTSLQRKMINQNKIILKMLDEYDVVYDTFLGLDDVYV